MTEEDPKDPKEPQYKVTTTPRRTEKNLTYDYRGLVSDPVPGIDPGTVLPLSDFPSDSRCPWCEDNPQFKTTQGLRGHAHGKHGIRWELPPKKTVERIPDWQSMTEPKDRESLKPWHMIGIAMHEVYGLTWDEVADRVGRGKSTLPAVASSPAGQWFRKRLHELFDEPEQIARLLLQANSINATADFLLAMQWAKEANDYDAVGRFAKDLIKMSGGLESSGSGSGGNEIHIHLGGGEAQLLSPTEEITTSYEVVEAELDEDEDP